jgi:hypothetical protein
LLALVVLGALAAGGALLLQQTNTSLHAQGNLRVARGATYCAEAGLAAGRDFFRSSPSAWSTHLQSGTQLTGNAGIGGTGASYTVRLVDNVDEFPPQVNNPLVDADQTVILVSRCNDAENPIELRQYLTTTPLLGQRTGFVYTTSDDQAEQLPVRTAATATLYGGAALQTVGTGAPRLLPSTKAALYLDGVSAAAVFTDDTVLDGTKGVEISLWFKAAQTQTANSTLVSKSHGAAAGNTAWSVEFDGSGKRVQFGVFTTVQTTGVSAWSAVDVNDNSWHYLVGRYDGRNVSLYLDNVLQSFTAASGDIRTNNRPMSVGRWESGPSRHYKGHIADLRVRTWSANTFHGFDGGVAIKFGGLSDTTGPQGQPALLFNGTSARAQVIDGPQMNGQEGLEVSLWLRADPTQAQYADVLSKGHGAASNNTGWNLEFLSTTGRLGFGVYTTGGGGSVTTINPVNDNQWHFLRAVYDGQYVTLWLDHLLQGRQPTSGQIKTNSKVLTVGAWELGPSRFFRGAIADLTVRSFDQQVVGYEDGVIALHGGAAKGVGHDGAQTSIVFNGTDARAWIPDSPYYRPVSGPKGIEAAFWMKAATTQTAHAAVLTKGHGAANGDTGWTFEFDASGTKLGFGVYTTSGTWGVSYATSLNDNQWHEVRGVYDGRRVYLYVDQALRASANTSGGDLLMNAKPDTLGYWEYATSRHFKGALDSVRVNPLYTPGDGATFLTMGQVQGGYDVSAGQWLALDWSGDRMTDLAHISGSNNINLWRSNGVAGWGVSSFTPWGSYNIQVGSWRAGDFNGDGRGDLAHICCGNYIHTWFSNGSGGFNVTTHSPSSGYGIQVGQWLAGDFNGDGRDDLAHICCSNYIHTWFSNGDGSYSTPTYSPGAGYGVQVGTWHVADVNGDGKDDLLHMCCANYMHTWLSLGNGNYDVRTFSPWAGYGIQNGKWLVGDFSGDGKDDVVHVVNNTDYVHPWYSNGDGSFVVHTFRPWGGYNVTNGEWLVGDLDEDRRMDLVHVVYNTSYVHQWRSLGNGGFSIGSYSPWAGYGIPNGRWMIGDVNRDRKADVIHAANPSAVNTWLSRH